MSNPADAIPTDILAAVATKSMPLRIFADWLEDNCHPWEELVRLLAEGGTWREKICSLFDQKIGPLPLTTANQQIMQNRKFSFSDIHPIGNVVYEFVTPLIFHKHVCLALTRREPHRWYYRLHNDDSASVMLFAPELDPIYRF